MHSVFKKLLHIIAFTDFREGGCFHASLKPRKLIHHLIYGAIGALIGHDDIFSRFIP